MYDSLKELKNDKLFIKTGASEFIDLIEEYRSIYNKMKISELFAQLLSRSGYEEMLRTSGDEERLDNLAELKRSIYDYEEAIGETYTLEEYLQKIALYTNSDDADKKDAVKLMTIHTAKGLEFPYVFLCKMNEGVFPSSKVKTKAELEEERRLAYVAITRAEKALIMTDAEGINFDQSFRYPSRFIFDIKKDLLNFVKPLSDEFIEQAERQVQLVTKCSFIDDSYRNMVNKTVQHPLFGKGKIVDIDLKGRCFIVQFENVEGTRNISCFYDKMQVEGIKDLPRVKNTEIKSTILPKSPKISKKKEVPQKARKAPISKTKLNNQKSAREGKKTSKFRSILKLFGKK